MNIVIVEDEAPIRQGLAGIISKIDKSYILLGTASNGLEGLELIEKTKPDVIIMDIQMPDLDGFTMLSRVREAGMECKAIVLTAYSDFGYAQRAIELGIENYLLKPIKIPELRKTLSMVEEKIKKERARIGKYTWDSVIMEGMTGQLVITPELTKALEENYGFRLDKPLYVFLVHMTEAFETRRGHVKEILDAVCQKQGFSSHIVEISGRHSILVMLYDVADEKKTQKDFEEKAASLLDHGEICAWRKIPDLTKLHQSLSELEKNLDWNLLFGKGVMISLEKIGDLNIVPFLYPQELENRAKNALINRQPMEFGECVDQFRERCRGKIHRPKDIKESCIRFCVGVLNTSIRYGYQTELVDQDILQTITKAVTWKEIDTGMEQMFRNILLTQSAKMIPASTMIQRADKIIREEYQNGLTLEELAGKLYVSEEYLSAQFKKETGKTFTETIRKVRMTKIKELLATSTLKLNQIAELAGYSDPKYMSRVFKEEMGILPAEYRKMHIAE